MRHELQLLLTALRLLTRVPVPAGIGRGPAWARASARHAPVVGLLVGGFGAAALWAAAHLWPASVAVGLSMLATLWMTGAVHERGLATAFDAAGAASGTPERPAAAVTGRLGVVALVVMLALKAAALHGLAVRDFGAALAALPLAHALSRAVPVVLLPGTGAARAAEPGTRAVALLWGLAAGALAVACGLDGGQVLLAVLAAAPAGLAMARWQPSGGDAGVLPGVPQQGAELAVYLGLLATLSHA